MPIASRIDGNKLLMVAYELIMTLFALLFAYPHIPDRILDDGSGDYTWFSVTSVAAFQAALENLLQTSGVLEVSLAKGRQREDITPGEVADLGRLSALFDLGLIEDGVPATCRQMYEHIVALFRTLTEADVGRLSTRDDLMYLYRQRGFVPRSWDSFLGTPIRAGPVQAPAGGEDHPEERSALIRFAERLAVEWLQPYFASAESFYLPEQVAAACRC